MTIRLTQKHVAFVSLAVIAVSVLMSAWSMETLARSHILSDPSFPLHDPRRPDLAYYGQNFYASYNNSTGVSLCDPVLRVANNVQRINVGRDETQIFDSFFDVFVEIPGESIAEQVTLTGPVQTIVHDKNGDTTGTFDTEIVSMSLSGNVGGMLVMLRESPSQTSAGQTTITDLGGGQFHVDSFFDVSTELSVDGGPYLVDVNGPGRLELCPEPVTMALLLIGGLALFRRRRSG